VKVLEEELKCFEFGILQGLNVLSLEFFRGKVF
jgi:hypothetical protein